MNSEQDIKHFQNLFTYLNIFLITPWYDFQKNTFYKRNLCKLYGCLLILMKIALVLFMALDKSIFEVFGTMTPSQKIGSGFVIISLGLLVSITATKSSFRDTDNWKILLRNCHYTAMKAQNTNSNLLHGFLTKQIFFLALASYILYVSLTFNSLSFLRTLAISPLPDAYYEFLIVILLVMIADRIKNGYVYLNTTLMKCAQSPKFVQEMRILTQDYRILGETIDIFNRMFGWQIIFILLHCGLQFVNCLNLVAISITIETHNASWYCTLISAVILFVLNLYGLLLLVMSIDSVNQEAHKFLDLCYKVQDQFKIESREVESIIKLTNYSKQFYRGFNSAGFFRIDKSIIFGLAGNVATYLIISMQFNESQNRN